jgi:hypothetical protein
MEMQTMNEARNLDPDLTRDLDLARDRYELVELLRHSAEKAQSLANKYASKAQMLALLADQEQSK